jgi:hypothetical protein
MTDGLESPDSKCTLEIMDYSSRYESRGLKVTIFWPEGNMPSVSGVADVVIIRNIKVSSRGIFFLLFIHIYSGPDVECRRIAHSA